jgi:hypothetical protein
MYDGQQRWPPGHWAPQAPQFALSLSVVQPLPQHVYWHAAAPLHSHVLPTHWFELFEEHVSAHVTV